MLSTDYKPKLIEVALPLAEINVQASREKSIRHGHPSTLHLWWARRPLVAARAVIWASLVDDPSADNSLSNEQQEAERQRLFGILERLAVWKNSNDPQVLAEAKAEIERCFPDGPPPILDPFGGGGSIPLEAQRLGLQALSGDLNPVAVLIQKAMIEIPPRFANRPPVHPDLQDEMATWERAQGLAADVEAYGHWMRDQAQQRIGHLYPDATGPNGEKLTPIAWIWARTVESPDPAWSGHVPLVASWYLAKRRGKPPVWIEPVIDRVAQTVRYEVRTGGSPSHPRTVNRGNGTCIATGAAIPGVYIKAEGRAGRMGAQLMAVVAEGIPRGRMYLGPTLEHTAATDVNCELILGPLPSNPQYSNPPNYGMGDWEDLFTPRQLTALTTFSDLLADVRGLVEAHAAAAGMASDEIRLRDGGTGADAYADAVVTYLAFGIDKQADLGNSLVRWEPRAQCPRQLFGRQAIPMIWDFAESNPFSSSSGSFLTCLSGTMRGLVSIGSVMGLEGRAVQMDAIARVRSARNVAVSTDPPYYDNVPYADISDFFYVWLRRNLADVWPDECATLLTPKADELVANRYRAGSKQKAEEHFESGMAEFVAEVAEASTPDVPVTIFYAYKATETSEGGVRSTGWDTFLQGVADAGMQITATWPMRTENQSRLRAMKSNALASSIVLVCRPRPEGVAPASRGQFVEALRNELPEAVRVLQTGNIAPVDMAQSTIGPGIGVFSRYAKVIEADGRVMPVSSALAIINDVLGEILDGEEAELDADSRFAVTWFAQHGYDPAASGDADNLARAKNTSLAGLEEAGIGKARGGRFRLYRRDELDPYWHPALDDRLTVWEATQHLVATLERSEPEAAALLHQLGGYADRARQLAYVLYKKANDNGRAEEASAYNGLITTWPDLLEIGAPMGEAQGSLL